MSIRSTFLAICVAVSITGCNAAPSAKPGAGGVDTSAAPAAAKTISFASDVKPILEKRCHDCHLGGGSKGGFNMDTRENALAAGRHGARIVEGNSSESRLILHVAQDPGVKRMPPKGEPLSADEVATLKAWIDQGAKWE